MHLNNGQLRAYLDGAPLNGSDRQLFERHLDGCAACQVSVLVDTDALFTVSVTIMVSVVVDIMNMLSESRVSMVVYVTSEIMLIPSASE